MSRYELLFASLSMRLGGEAVVAHVEVRGNGADVDVGLGGSGVALAAGEILGDLGANEKEY